MLKLKAWVQVCVSRLELVPDVSHGEPGLSGWVLLYEFRVTDLHILLASIRMNWLIPVPNVVRKSARAFSMPAIIKLDVLATDWLIRDLVVKRIIVLRFDTRLPIRLIL